ncbi:hypothetical protein MAR_024189 [Mya arenaria]|uniref:Uncharacterized protein n=1 Tax=Mya arenaria TaxID=6604 RepID=A0ABY7DT83_MYAAR|nr:hypothetical protein MAR_024189 [Mya arenaria]
MIKLKALISSHKAKSKAVDIQMLLRKINQLQCGHVTMIVPSDCIMLEHAPSDKQAILATEGNNSVVPTVLDVTENNPEEIVETYEDFISIAFGTDMQTLNENEVFTVTKLQKSDILNETDVYAGIPFQIQYPVVACSGIGLMIMEPENLSTTENIELDATDNIDVEDVTDNNPEEIVETSEDVNYSALETDCQTLNDTKDVNCSALETDCQTPNDTEVYTATKLQNFE